MTRRASAGAFVNVVQAVAAAAAIGVCGAAWSTYLGVRDLRAEVAVLSAKLDWLYRHEFPDMP